MPEHPLKPCSAPMCPALLRGGKTRCPKHTQDEGKRDRRDRGSAWSRGYDTRWAKLRNLFIKRNPLCVMCEADGRVEPATLVDHITPITDKEDPNRLRWLNLQSLCHPCHNRKTAEDRKDGTTR